MRALIIAHCLVRNEERFIWYSLMSALPFVDKIMVWDTGSKDKTVEIIRSINSPKIEFKEVGGVDENSLTRMRQEMLDETPDSFNWIMILDGDEIWPDQAIKTATDFARSHTKLESLVVRTINLVGDVYHRLPEDAGQYRLAGFKGHLSLRFINRKEIPGLNVKKPHPLEGYFDGQGKLIQDRDPAKIKLVDVAYFHATHLHRSQIMDPEVVKREKKFKHELGIKIPQANMPSVFTADRPMFVPNVLDQAPLSYWARAIFVTVPKRVKRFILQR